MIFVSLGTQDKPFTRLLSGVEKLIKDGIIKDRVVVQAGSTVYDSNLMEISSWYSEKEMHELIKTCDLLITHGGVGTIVSGLHENKKILVMPRLKKYREHVNDHQIQITEYCEKNGYVIPVYDENDMESCYLKAVEMEPITYVSNQKNFCKLVSDKINSLLY